MFTSIACGGHWRDDLPDQRDLETSYYTIACQTAGDFAVERAPVEFTMVRSGETILKGSNLNVTA